MSKKKKTLEYLEKEYDQLSPEMKQYIELSRYLAVSVDRIKNLPLVTYLYMRYEELREDMTVNAAYDELCKSVCKRGFDPKDYLHTDPESFNRAYNRWKSRRLKNK